MEVNVPSTMKAEIKVELENKTATVGCLFHIKDEISRLMERDNFARYKKTDEFKAFLTEIGGAYTGVHMAHEGHRYRSMQINNMARSPNSKGIAARSLVK
jgi:altronate dehydratase